jgi:hypothetical protein
MKKVFISSVIILVAVLYFGCAKKKTNLEFDITYTTDLAIPTLTTGTTYTLLSPNVATNINAELEKNNTDANLVGEAKYTLFKLAVKTPTAGNLGFIRSVKFYINATNLPEQQVSWRYNQGNDTIKPITTPSITLNVNDPNLKNRFMENSVYFKYNIQSLTATAPITLTATHNIHIKAISH